jgi:phosphatidylserine/phosphatidylglycerophosphate/cardiolipin synthase-like enzyme
VVAEPPPRRSVGSTGGWAPTMTSITMTYMLRTLPVWASGSGARVGDILPVTWLLIGVGALLTSFSLVLLSPWGRRRLRTIAFWMRSRRASRLERFIGARISAVERAYHLHPRLGQPSPSMSLAGLWSEGQPPMRQGNKVEVLIDGGQLLPRIAKAFAHARSHVLVAGWFFTPEMRLTAGDHAVVLRELLADVGARVDVYLLMWAGAPLPGFAPWRRDVRRVRRRLCRGGRIHCALDKGQGPTRAHHEKLVVVDDEVAFVGGIDLTHRHGDRLDTNEHPLRQGISWHDVATELRGPVVADVAAHFKLRWQEVTGEVMTNGNVPSPAGESRAQLVATIPGGVYRVRPQSERRILEAYYHALSSAERLIYLENQFLWAPVIVAVLRRKLRHPPSDAFRLIIVLPAAAKKGATATLGHLGRLARADPDGKRFLACGLYSHQDEMSRPIYVHAKVGIVDDRWLTVGSANLNQRSLFHDTEVNVVTDDERCVRETRLRLWAEHLELPPERVAGDPTALFDDMWKPLAEEQLARRQAGKPMTHRLVRLPYVPSNSGLLGPLEGVFIDG